MKASSVSSFDVAIGGEQRTVASETGDDAVRPFAVESLDTRGRAVHVDKTLNRILKSHDYPAPVSRLLGEMIVLTTLLGTSLKFEGQFIVQTQTDGPVSLLVVDFRTPGDIRAYARFDEDALEQAIQDNTLLPEQLLGKGILAMTVDQGRHMQRYQGMVPLEGTSLEEVAHTYFRQSEQIPTRLRLAVGELVTPGENGAPERNWRAGGLLIQFLPESKERIKHRDLPGGDGAEEEVELDEDNAWVEAQSLFATIKDDELTDPDISVEALLYRLFHEQGVRVYEPQAVQANCSCSGEKIWELLKAMPEDDYRESIKEGVIEVKCEFCGTDYTVTPEELGRVPA